MSPVSRWEPDDQLVAAALAGTTRTMADLDPPDRCWVVAGLMLAGYTAEDISDRLSCSLRLVRTVRADPMTEVCLLMQTETRNFTDELRMVSMELRAALRRLDATTVELERTRGQLRRTISGQADPVCPEGHVLAGYNRYTAPSGKVYCRQCHRDSQARYRTRRRSQVQPGPA